jgi:N-acetylglucosamine-6-sulfatase
MANQETKSKMKMSPWEFILLLKVMCSFLCSNAAAGDQRPNIVFVFSDDHANRAISAYSGGEINHTPNIDRIAKEGVIFERSYCTNSICGPSRASILTGKFSHNNGVYGNGSFFDTDQFLFPRALKNNGYQTALYGKWHLNSNPADAFHEWKILMGAGRQGYYHNPNFVNHEGKSIDEKGYSSDIIADDAIHWLKNTRSADAPFMMMVQFKAPHVPRMPALRYVNAFDNDTIPEPETLFDDYQNRLSHAKDADMSLHASNVFDADEILAYYDAYHAGKNPERIPEDIYWRRMDRSTLVQYLKAYEKENQELKRLEDSGALENEKTKRSVHYQRFIKDYLRVIAAVDENVGRILDVLDAEGLRENTLVVYCSDQSYYTGEHGWAEKRFMYEEGLKMPLLMRWPKGFKGGRVLEQMVQNIDYAPTFLEMAGVSIPEDVDGRSFLPLLQGKEVKNWRDSIYYHYYEHGGHAVPRHEGVKLGDYKLIHYYSSAEWEFFDLGRDPHELKSEMNNPEYAQVIAQLKSRLAEHQKEYGLNPAILRAPYPKINWWEHPEHNAIMRARGEK